MMIFLTHQRHGHKIAYSMNEADRDKKSGWQEVTQEQYYDRPKKAAVEAVADAADVQPEVDTSSATKKRAKKGKDE